MMSVIQNRPANDLVKKEFLNLKKHIGKIVVVIVTSKTYGDQRYVGRLEVVEDFDFIKVGGTVQKIIGLNSSIFTIKKENGIILYENNHINYAAFKKQTKAICEVLINQLREKRYGTISYNLD